MPVNKYYPPLSDVVQVNDLPEILGFVKNGIQELFENIYYKNLQSSKSIKGDSAFYGLDIVSPKKLAIELPGTGIFLVLNPDQQDFDISTFPITVAWEWKVLAYKRYFNTDNFSFSVEDIFNLTTDILGIGEEEVVNYAIRKYVIPVDASIPRIQQFVTDINTEYGTSIVVPSNPETQLEDLVYEINQQADVSAYIAVLSTYILVGDSSSQEQKLKDIFAAFVPDDLGDYIKDIIFPKIRATLELSAGLEFPRNLVQPVYDELGVNPYDPTDTGEPYEVIPEVGDDGYPKVLLTFGEANFQADTQEGLGYNMELVLNTNVPAQIGNTGLIIDIQNLKIDLSESKNFIEADLDGRPPEFMGVYTDYTVIVLPKKWFNNVDNTTLQIAGRNLLIGTGGISGTIALETVGGLPTTGDDYLNLNVGNWVLGFNYFDLVFRQNTITESNIVGLLTIPKLKDASDQPAKIEINGHINEAGDFNLTASEPQGIPFTLFDFVTFNFLSVELGREDDNFYIGTACQIWFENETMQKIIGDQIIEIPRLRVYDNGSIEIVGGNGFIPTNISLDLGPIEVAVTGIHYGSSQQEYDGDMRKYNYWGFDGAISLDPLGIDARGEGIKYYYTTDNDELDENGDPKYTGGDSFLRVQTIEVDLIIPGSASPETALAIIHGLLSIPEPGVTQEYKGEIGVKLPKARIAGAAHMRLQPRHPAFIIEAGFDIPTPIPVGATGLGFYGFGGLLGYQYVADKAAVGLEAEDRWYDYFTYPERGVNIDKFVGPERFEELGYTDAFSIGAGTVLGTIFDDGNLFSTRLMAILSLPQVFILDGRANVLGDRLGMLDHTEPPFFAFVAISADSIEFGFGADYELQKSNGWILDIYAEVQAGFFFNNSSAWYVNFGTRDNPITATLFKSLLNLRSQAYLMLSAQGIEAGARIDFDLRKRFGPFKVHIWAYLEVGGYISFERPQIGGYIAAGGGIDVDVWIIGITLSLEAIFSAEASKPFLIYAEVDFRACVKILFARICKNFTIKLKWEKNRTVDRSPIPALPTNRKDELVKGIHMLTNETFDLNSFNSPPSVGQISKIIPMDTYIEFKTEKGLLPGAVTGSGMLGGYTFPPENHVDLIPPDKTVRGGHVLRQVKHRYSIEDIQIKAWNGGSWVDYHPFEAVVAADERPEVANLRIGYWQIKGKQYDTIRLLATTPFTYMEAGEPGWVIPELYGITPSTLFCSEDIIREDCSNVLNRTLGTKYYPPTQYVGHFINGAYYTLSNVSGYEIIDGNLVVIENDYMEVTDDENVFGFVKSLAFSNYNKMEVILPEPSFRVQLKLTTDAEGATVSYYEAVIDDLTSTTTYVLVHQVYKTAAQLDTMLVYENEDNPISKVIIGPDNAGTEKIVSLMEQIAELFEATYDKARGEVTVTEPSDTKLYEELLAKLEAEKSRSCSEKDPKKEGNGCDPDPKVCELYNKLFSNFDDCFKYPVFGVPELIALKECFNEWHGYLTDFDKVCPEYDLLKIMGTLYTDFLEKLKNLNGWLSNYPGGVNDQAIIALYYELRECAIQIMAFVNDLGDCDCDDRKDKCNTSLQEICWLTLENHQWNETIPGSEAVEEEYQDMIEGLQKTAQPIWRPNTAYYIKYSLKDDVDDGESNPGEYDYYYGFKTVGPLGHYHKNPAVDYIPAGGTADEYPLTSLRSYIDYNKSFPNADGNLLRAKPAFYANGQFTISLFFQKPLALHMLNKWHEYNGLSELDGALHIAIKDPVTNTIIPYPLPADFNDESVPTVDEGVSGWTGDNDPLIPVHIQAIMDMIENGDIPCDIVLGDPIVPASSHMEMVLTDLKPQKLYTALLYNAFEVSTGNVVSEQVHEFVFQTSRYRSFEEQVKSYLLDVESLVPEQAVFELPITVDATSINKAFDIIANPEDQIGDPLENQYQHLFDRVTEGVLGITPTDPPVRTEFHKIVNTTTSNVVAILIRNPEPFNIPSIPLEDVQDTIQVTFASGSTHGSYRLLHSKDYSQAIAMRGSGNITAPKMHFKFTYLTPTETGYDSEEIQVGDIIINE